MRHNQRSYLLIVALLFLIRSLALPTAQAQQVGASWTDSSGNWSNPANWSTLTVPNNGGGTTYSVTIGTANAVVTMDVANDTIDNLTLGTTTSQPILYVGSLSLVSGTSFNYGDIVNREGTITSYGTFSNTGHIRNVGDSFGGPSATLTNNGTLNNNVGGGILVQYGQLINNNLLTNSGGIIIDNASATNYGTLINSSGGLITLTDLGTGLVNYGTLNNSGIIDGGDAEFSYIQNQGLLINSSAGQLQSIQNLLNQGTFINNGSFVNACDQNGVCAASNTGILINNGTFTNVLTPFNQGDGEPAPQCGVSNNTNTTINCVFINSGTFVNNSKLQNFGTFNSTGTFINNGMLLLQGSVVYANGGAFNNTGTFTNSSAVTISSSGLFTTSTNYTQTGGSTLVDGTLTAIGSAIVSIQGGTLGGTGTINGNVSMGGTITPADPGTPGTLTIFGNYEQTGNGIFDELIGPLSHSFLDVSGTLALDPGSLLEITLLNGYDPLNQTFSIMDFASLNGQFTNGASFWDDGYLWDITYYQHEVDVTAVQAPEPSSLLLLFLGLATLASFAHRKMDKSQRLA